MFHGKGARNLEVYKGPDGASHSGSFCCTLHYVPCSYHSLLSPLMWWSRRAETPRGSQERRELWRPLWAHLNLIVRKHQAGAPGGPQTEQEFVGGSSELVSAWGGESQGLWKIGRVAIHHLVAQAWCRPEKNSSGFSEAGVSRLPIPLLFFPLWSLPSTLHPVCLLSTLGLLELSVHKNHRRCLWKVQIPGP